MAARRQRHLCCGATADAAEHPGTCVETIRSFGRLADGRDVRAFRIGNVQGIEAEILELGGILSRLRVPGEAGPVDVVLGLPDAQAYGEDPAFLGILVGRYGNRIGGAHFVLDGQHYKLSANEGGNHLHGGVEGFGRRMWTLQEHRADALALRYRSPAGEEGYPGNLEVTATFRIDGDALRLIFEASCDAPTPFNPTHHPYFNLAGERAVPAATQLLQAPVAGVLPVGRDLIPLGHVQPAAGTPFDFHQAAALQARMDAQDPQLRIAGGYDHCLVLERGRAHAAALYSPHSGVAMRIDCDAPALQLYGGQALARQHPGLGDGICLEPQDYPDAPNQPAFPTAVLRPGTAYRREIAYRFACPGRDRPWHEVAAALGLA